MSDRITVIGNIATEPEQRRTGSGIPVTTFRLASSQRYRDPQSGEWVDGTTNWYRICVFRSLGENAFASLRKGQRIIVDGKLRVKEWEAGGKKGIEVEVEADAIGPDLKWGTAVFHKRAAGEPTSSGAAPTVEGTADADVWSLPGGVPTAGLREQTDAATATAEGHWAPAEPEPAPF
ncbi:single-stranded DNA-binding protein [Microbacterium sp. NM3R9]|uniref:single-stranded DNA-binding protein n=1 Tax=Microbacterium thalli TaxID=3027921 RepID=UPI002367325A|nr:single-stranded DNA-binding protein [Microbacterium thalli]MDN8547587.1 single-stranded DNA-binding protein [Microbacterium thalli]